MLFSLFSTTVISAPIPSRPTGLVYNEDASDIIVEMYADPLCSDCLDSWSTVVQVMNRYQSTAKFIIHFLPLPYHTYSFMTTRLLMHVNTTVRKQLLDALYNGDQDKFLNGANMKVKSTDVHKKLCDWAAGISGISSEEICKDASAEMDARIEFKYAACHHMDGTPTFLVNGVVASDLGADSTFQDWVNVIEPLLKKLDYQEL